MWHFCLLDANGQSIVDGGSDEVFDNTLCLFFGVGNEGIVVIVEEVMQRHICRLCLGH